MSQNGDEKTLAPTNRLYYQLDKVDNFDVNKFRNIMTE